MVIRVSKPEFNLRDKLTQLDRPVGAFGSQMLESSNKNEAAHMIGLGRKNLIINGGFNINQRKYSSRTTASGNGSLYNFTGGRNEYTFDQWYLNNNTTGVYTAQVTSATPYPPECSQYLELACTTTDASLGTTQYAQLSYNVEGYDLQQTGWGTRHAKPLTLSFYHRHSSAGTYGGVLRNAAANYNFVFEYTQTAEDVWEKAVIHIHPETTQSWDNTNGVGLRLSFSFCNGASHITSNIGKWHSGTYYHTSNRQMNFMNNTNNRMRFTAIQLEVGRDATPFEYLPMQTQMALCQRYYWEWGNESNSSNGPGRWVGSGNGATTPLFGILFPHEMRAGPTITPRYSGSFNVYQGSSTSAQTSFTSTTTSPTSARININGPSGHGTSPAWVDIGSGGSQLILTFSAEL